MRSSSHRLAASTRTSLRRTSPAQVPMADRALVGQRGAGRPGGACRLRPARRTGRRDQLPGSHPRPMAAGRGSGRVDVHRRLRGPPAAPAAGRSRVDPTDDHDRDHLRRQRHSELPPRRAGVQQRLRLPAVSGPRCRRRALGVDPGGNRGAGPDRLSDPGGGRAGSGQWYRQRTRPGHRDPEPLGPGRGHRVRLEPAALDRPPSGSPAAFGPTGLQMAEGRPSATDRGPPRPDGRHLAHEARLGRRPRVSPSPTGFSISAA